MNVNGNGIMGRTPIPWETHSHGFFFCCKLALCCRPIDQSSPVHAGIRIRRMTVEIFLSDFQSIVNGVNFYFFQRSMSSFRGTIFLLLDCLLFAFTRYCSAVRVWEWETQWESHRNGNKT